MSTKKNPIVVGISFIIAGPLSAFLSAAVLALGLGLSFNACFYTIWAVLTVLGALSIIGGIMEAVEKRKSIKS